jgi:hypothetical protein
VKPIDPIEALLSVIGIRPFIYRNVPTVTKEHLDKAGRLPSTIEKQARALCRGELTGVRISALDYKKTLRELYEDYEPKDFELATKAMAKNAADLDTPLLAKVGEVIGFLRDAFPRDSYTTLEGQDQLEPNEYDVIAFTAILDALDNPMTVFNGMANASVLGSQVAAVHQAYPTLSASIEEAVTEMPAEMRAASSKFNLPWDTEVGINKWLGRPPVDPELVSALRAAAAAQQAAQAPAPKPNAPAQNEQQVKGALSDADRAQYQAATGVK